MLRVRDLDAALDFYCSKLGLTEVRRRVDEKNRYTLVFLAGPADANLVADSKRAGRDAPLVELTYNWDSEDYGEARYFGHLAFEVDDIYALCDRLMKAGVTINRPPRDGNMAFNRAAAEGRRPAPQRAVAVDAEHRKVVKNRGRGRCPPMLARGAKGLYMSRRF
jgi:lactoylglutathione lyase